MKRIPETIALKIVNQANVDNLPVQILTNLSSEQYATDEESYGQYNLASETFATENISFTYGSTTVNFTEKVANIQDVVDVLNTGNIGVWWRVNNVVYVAYAPDPDILTGTISIF